MCKPWARYVLLAAVVLTFTIYILSDKIILPKITGLGPRFDWFSGSLSDNREHNCTDCATKNNSSKFTDVFGTYMFPQPKCDGKLLVYECTTWLCGGLADREKGIMSTFLLSLLTDRTFVIEHRKPCELKQFLEPTLYDWSKCLPQVAAARSKGHRFINYIDGMGNALPQNFSNLKQGDLWPQHVVTLKINQYIPNRIKDHPDVPSKLPWLRTSPPVKVVTGLMHALFKPVTKLETHLEQYINNQTENRLRQFVAVHIRTDFLQNKTDDVKFIFEFLKLHFSDKTKYCLYIATDKMEVRNKARDMFDNFASINGEIMNIDWPRGKNISAAMYIAVFEQLVLSRADILVLTRSGFSEIAAYIRGTSQSIHFMTLNNNTNANIFEQIELSQLSDKSVWLILRQQKLHNLNKHTKQ